MRGGGFFYKVDTGQGRNVEAATDRLIATMQGFVEPLLAGIAIELVEIQYRREGFGWVLRFFIDKEGGVTIDDCARVSREISAYLEVEDLLDHAYTLEVSSPGLERPLKKREDFTRYAGRLARIKLLEPMDDGQRLLIGTLRGLEGDAVALVVDGKEVMVDLNNIARARLTL
jgi:ribosome maturation factor RimP